MTLTQEQKIEEIISPSINDMGYDIVRIKFMDSYGRRTLQIMAENRETGNLVVEDCSKISRMVSAIMDVEDPIDGEYDLEVSSPGIDRPLTRIKDFEKYNGFEVKLQTATPIEGRRKFIGRLKGIEGNEISLIANDQPEKTYKIAFNNIATAKLVINEELLAKAAIIEN